MPTPSLTSTASASTQPPSTLPFSTDHGFIPGWTLPALATFLPTPYGLALSLPPNTPLTSPFPYGPGTITAQLYLTTGTALLYTQQSTTGGYLVTLDVSGTLTLYRTGLLLATATATPPTDGWWLLSFSATSTLTLSLNGDLLISLPEPAPLPAGTLTLLGTDGLLVHSLTLPQTLPPTPDLALSLPQPLTIELLQPNPSPVPITPTPLPPTHFKNNISNLSIVDPANSYAVVESAAELITAIQTANMNPPSVFHIFVKAGTYDINTPLFIQKTLKIYGLGSEITILRSIVTQNTLFYVSGSLHLQDLTLTGGTYGYGGYGGIILNASTLSMHNVVLRNNSAAYGGGGITNLGSLAVDNSIFLSNQFPSNLGGGGAIQNSGPPTPGTLAVTCSLFQQNFAFYGGAILNANGNVQIQNSVFQINRVSGDATVNGSAIYNTSNAIMTAHDNYYWPRWNGTPIPGTNNPTNPGEDTIAGFTITSVLPADPTGTAVCPNPRPHVTLPSAADELLKYGVTLDPTVDWTTPFNAAQLNAFLLGVRDTAIALGVQSIFNAATPDDSPRQTFKRVVSDLRGAVSGIQFSLGTQPYCITNKNADPLEARITCSNSVALTPYTITHELGHVFVDRTGGAVSGTSSLFGLIQDANIRDANPSDIGVQAVFGNGFFDKTRSPDWRRGPRGWGSAPVLPGRCDGSITPTPSAPPTDFQQNPCDVVDALYLPGSAILTTEREEAAADMFLNWVYRVQGNGGFLNVDWAGCLPDGCLDIANAPGDVRMNWMNTTLTSLFAIHQW